MDHSVSDFSLSISLILACWTADLSTRVTLGKSFSSGCGGQGDRCHADFKLELQARLQRRPSLLEEMESLETWNGHVELKVSAESNQSINQSINQPINQSIWQTGQTDLNRNRQQLTDNNWLTEWQRSQSVKMLVHYSCKSLGLWDIST